MPRNYRQFCALARALDVVGERWTLLIVRELMLGPRRYSDLLDALPGIGTNLLAGRLVAMEVAGICVKADRLYELTDRGRGLEPAVLALARWGMSPMAEPVAGECMRPDWYAVAMLAAHNPSARRGRRETYEFNVDDCVFHLAVGEGLPRARRGHADRPAFQLRADLADFLALATRTVSLSQADISGDAKAAERWLDAFALPQVVPAAR